MRLRIFAVLIMAVVAFGPATPLWAQRSSSLADRVSALEQQMHGALSRNGAANNELLEQVLQLRTEVQSLRGTIERLEYENEQLKQLNRTQYLDTDSRLNRLEGGSGNTSSSSPPVAIPVLPSAMPESPERPRGIVATIATATEEPVTSNNARSQPLQDEHQAYTVALDALKAANYVESAQRFLDFLQHYPSGTYAPNALYWLGESYYVTGNYELAQEQFNVLITRYPTHDKAAGGWLKLGLSQLGQGDIQGAVDTLAQVTTRFQGTDVAKTAADRLNTLEQRQPR